MIGESFSASGGLNLAASLGVFEEGFLPPTINYVQPDKRCDLDYVPNKPRYHKIKVAASNALGFGGHNATLVVKKYT